MCSLFIVFTSVSIMPTDFLEFTEKNTSDLNHKVNFGYNTPQIANTKVL